MSYLNTWIIPNSIRWIREGIVRHLSIPEVKQRQGTRWRVQIGQLECL